MTEAYSPAPSNHFFTLIVQDRPVHCSWKVIASSSLFMDVVELVEDAVSPIPIPAFISRPIMLDLIEMVEKEDWECAHLVLVSLSYLMDFLFAVDFLGCERLKLGVEEKVKDKLSDSNWVDVLNQTKNILGLDSTVKNIMEFISGKLNVFAVDKDSLTMENDPYQEEYEEFSPLLMKLLVRSPSLATCSKVCILRKWSLKNLGERRDAFFEMINNIDYKDLDDIMMGEIESAVGMWDISDEELDAFTKVLDNARKERDLEAEKEHQLQFQLNREQFWKLIERVYGDVDIIESTDEDEIEFNILYESM